MSKILGYFNKFMGNIIGGFLLAIIFIVNFLVQVFSSFRQIIGLVLSMGGCLIMLFIFNPVVLLYIFSNPLILTLVILSVIVPFIGQIAVSYLEYIKYMATEYFYDKADYYFLGRKASFEKMQDYGKKYREDMERERIRREQERRKREEDRRRQAEEEYRRRYENFGGGTYWTFGGAEDFEEFFRQAQGGQYQNHNGQNQAGGYTSYSFKDDYESACDTLGVKYTADKYEIKLAYKKMAKIYHPDLNKEAGATEMFQKINNAYEFLNDSNIQKYKNMN